jgi:hypothetical protein
MNDTECWAQDDGIQVTAVEAVLAGMTPQSLWIRVGPVYGPGSVVQQEPGIWISYQEAHLSGPLYGPVLLTPEVWNEIAVAVERRIRRWKKKNSRHWWRR